MQWLLNSFLNLPWTQESVQTSRHDAEIAKKATKVRILNQVAILIAVTVSVCFSEFRFFYAETLLTYF